MKNTYEYQIHTTFIKRDHNLDYTEKDNINALDMVLNKKLYEDIIDDAKSSSRDVSFEFVSHSLTPVNNGYILTVLVLIRE